MTKVSPTQVQRPLPPVYLPQDPYGDTETERQSLPPYFHRPGSEPSQAPAATPDSQAARCARAAALVPFVEPLNGQGWAVPSCKSPEIRYLVSKANGHLVCTCPDFDKHREEPGFSCKHVFAVQQWQAQQPAAPSTGGQAGAKALDTNLLPTDGRAVVAPEPVADVAEAYRQMDTLDEQAILQELEGGVVREYVYRFRLSSGQQVDGLSWPGQKAVARELQRRGLLGPISMTLVTLEDRDDEYKAVVEAKDTSTGASYLGAKSQAKLQRGKDGKEAPDKDALSKVISKAQRNALRNFLPEQLVLAAISKFLAQRGAA